MELSSVITLALFCIVVGGQEPQCSRYYYESQTLERVIKAEINLDALRKDIQQINQEKVQTDEQNMKMEEKLKFIQQDFEVFKNNRESKTNSMRQFCTSDATCSDVEEAECKWLMCKCKPGLSYHHGLNKCVSDCGDQGYGRTFQVEMDTLLYGFATKTFKAISLEDCVNNCLKETGFICRTVEYKKADKTCYLSWETLHTNPDSLRTDREDYVLYTRDCRTD